MLAAAPAAAAVTEAPDALMNSPSAFCTAPKAILFWVA
jgi:hypothetical protein